MSKKKFKNKHSSKTATEQSAKPSTEGKQIAPVVQRVSPTLTPVVTVTLTTDESALIVKDNLNHTLRINADVEGLRVLKLMLRAKKYNPNSTLGSVAQPTQQMVEDFLRKKKLEEEEKKQDELKELKDLF
jgi:ABC-type dipeptide/oligopeptide/nickel transport system ATPase component